MQTPLIADIEDYQDYFDQMYMRGLPCLLNENGAYLAFLVMVTAVDTLAGLIGTSKGTGERFREFVMRYFPSEYHEVSEELWKLRNSMVHSFNPGIYFGLTVNVSKNHLKLIETSGLVHLNAENFYAALLYASRNYFERLGKEPELQKEFLKRAEAKDGGAPQVIEVNFNPVK